MVLLQDNYVCHLYSKYCNIVCDQCCPFDIVSMAVAFIPLNIFHIIIHTVIIVYSLVCRHIRYP